MLLVANSKGAAASPITVHGLDVCSLRVRSFDEQAAEPARHGRSAAAPDPGVAAD